MVGRNAFLECPQLRNILTPSKVIVVEVKEHGNGRVTVVTGGTIALHRHGREKEPNRLILASPYLASMNSADVERVKDAINRIAGAGQIRSRFLGLLSAHRRVLASILKRAPLWISEGGGVEPGVVEIILSFLGDVEG